MSKIIQKLLGDRSIEKYKDYGPLFLRVGLGIVFLLFGYQKLSVPEQTASQIQAILNVSLSLAAAANLSMGLAEILLGIGLIAGAFNRYVAPLAAAMVTLIFVSITLKYGIQNDPSLYRDIAIIGGALCLWFIGPGALSWDNRNKKTIV
ncbi:MAG: hypothetical protein A3B23_01060 [Candidatus Colwellbacteria bacterium RIFCSPLOWO2_01_FULL_48_10]|uniref:DoxX family protein n=1 Tax=Candidatus Colwellbacteria bacterium RIFCSPLOWO2_01_FULL_48_10 TaxID=1797690 RepID=A0A1G1Z4E8_9BACT|nr:MAG: hypothetical protein A3B23_01060 [Candidatus Colwellbacteria bacterium RIFCSPLOWO2_01_FULL_48_10]